MKKFGSAIILAGGKSSRMGFDKQLLKIDKRRLMNSLIFKLQKQFEEIIIVTNRPELYIGLSQKITKDILPDMGPLGGIHAGLNICSSKYAFVVACDMPNINMKYVEFMKEKLNSPTTYGCVTKFGEWIEPFSSFYSVELIEHIEVYLKTKKKSINGLLKNLEMTYIKEEDARSFSLNWDMFLNLNTNEDLNNYLLNMSAEWGS